MPALHPVSGDSLLRAGECAIPARRWSAQRDCRASASLRAPNNAVSAAVMARGGIEEAIYRPDEGDIGADGWVLPYELMSPARLKADPTTGMATNPASTRQNSIGFRRCFTAAIGKCGHTSHLVDRLENFTP